MQIDKSKCVGCANCVPVCPMGAIYIGPDKLAEINQDECVECHTCYRGLSVENLPPTITRFLRRCLAAVGLRFQPEPDICPTGAFVPDELTWPRIVRRAFSDPQVPHESTGIHGRGTAEVYVAWSTSWPGAPTLSSPDPQRADWREALTRDPLTLPD